MTAAQFAQQYRVALAHQTAFSIAMTNAALAYGREPSVSTQTALTTATWNYARATRSLECILESVIRDPSREAA